MPAYAFLPRASANRVYGESAFALTAGELAVLDQHGLGGILAAGAIERVELGGVGYLRVEAAAPLDGPAAALVSQASTLHALFELEAGEAPVRLRPVEVTPCAVRTTT